VVDGRIARLEQFTEQQRYLEVMDLAPSLLAERSRGLRAYGHFFLGQALNRLFRPDEAIDHLVRARTLFEALDEPWLAAECLEWEAGARYLKEDTGALAMAQEALRRYRELEPRAAEVESRMLEHIGTILVRHQDYTQARDCYEEALRVAGRRLDISRLARIYHGLGSCHASLGDVQRAIELTSRAVTLYQVENDIRPQGARVDLPRAEGDLGVWHLSQPMERNSSRPCSRVPFSCWSGATGASMTSHAVIARMIDPSGSFGELAPRSAFVQPGDLVLVKGSRGIRTDLVVDRLKAEFA